MERGLNDTYKLEMWLKVSRRQEWIISDTYGENPTGSAVRKKKARREFSPPHRNFHVIAGL